MTRPSFLSETRCAPATMRGPSTAPHTLKGVLANLGLTPIYDIVVRIVEPLRAKSAEGVMEEYEKLLAARERLEKTIGKYVN